MSAGGSTAGRGSARIPFLDAARGWAITGVVLVHSFEAIPGEPAAASAGDVVPDLVRAVTGAVFLGASRALLTVLLGIGLVLTWRSTGRGGGSPQRLLARRYAVLFVVFGLVHWYFFRPDILTHYALVVFALLPVLPWLLRGRSGRPLVVVAVCLPLHGALALLAPELPRYLPFDLVKAPMTAVVLAVGIALARLPGLAGPGRWARRVGLAAPVVVLVGAAGLAATALVVFDDTGRPDLPPLGAAGVTVLLAGGVTALSLGRALLYLGLIRWLVDRGRRAARLCGVLVPLGRMSLTVYLGSTLVYLGGSALLGLLTGLGPERLTVVIRFGIGLAYVVLMAVACRRWLRRFRYGPAEWLWRRLTHGRPLPMRHSSGVGSPAGGGQRPDRLR